MPDRGSTLEGIPERESGRLAQVASRVFIGFLFVLCVAGGLGVLGGHTATASSARNGYRLELSYPGTARPGLDAFWELRVTHPGGFHGPVTIAVTGTYFDLFETQGFYPTPSGTTRDARYVYLTFTPPPHGDAFTVMYDAYIQPYVAPSHLLGQHATVALVEHGTWVDSLPFTTWMWP